MLSEEAKRLKREYARKWRQKNPEKVRASMERHWEKKAAESSQPIEQRVLSLHNKGLSLREIGDKLGLNHMKVKRILAAVTSVTD